MSRIEAARLVLAIALACALGAGASAETVSLRYGLEAGQRWTASQTIERTTHILGESQSDRGVAHFRYAVESAPVAGHVSLVAHMLSQEMSGGESPFDFSQIRFLAFSDPRGTMRGVHFEIGNDAEPPDVPGIEKDPVAYREMLRRFATAWSDSVFWLPELPEQALSVGESFTIGDRGDVGGSDPGVAMEMTSKRTYTLDRIEGPIAHFSIRLQSTVDAATAKSSVESEQRALGTAAFDLDAGMWTRQETRSEHRATFQGGPGGEGVATASTVTTIEMRSEEP
jgi:hypothetical protein